MHSSHHTRSSISKGKVIATSIFLMLIVLIEEQNNFHKNTINMYKPQRSGFAENNKKFFISVDLCS